MAPSTSSTSSRPCTAFISGPLEVSHAYFERYYAPRILAAIAEGHSFVIGPASGIDALALDFLLAQGVSTDRIDVYMGWFEKMGRNYEHIQKKLGEKDVQEVTVRTREAHGLERVGQEINTTQERDAAMTAASDYDILRFRTETEQKRQFGHCWQPRVSNTERNWRRRERNPNPIMARYYDEHGENGHQENATYVTHLSPEEARAREETKRSASLFKAKVRLVVVDLLGRSTIKSAADDTFCDGTCDAHRDVVECEDGRPFGVGSDGDRFGF